MNDGSLQPSLFKVPVETFYEVKLFYNSIWTNSINEKNRISLEYLSCTGISDSTGTGPHLSCIPRGSHERRRRPYPQPSVHLSNTDVSFVWDHIPQSEPGFTNRTFLRKFHSVSHTHFPEGQLYYNKVIDYPIIPYLISYKIFRKKFFSTRSPCRDDRLSVLKVLLILSLLLQEEL